jgi:hypothetical protein
MDADFNPPPKEGIQTLQARYGHRTYPILD